MVRANGLMSKTRGGAAACARVVGDKVSYAGVGNISGTLISVGKSQGLVSHNGTLGLHQRRSPAVRIPSRSRRTPDHAFGRVVRALGPQESRRPARRGIRRSLPPLSIAITAVNAMTRLSWWWADDHRTASAARGARSRNRRVARGARRDQQGRGRAIRGARRQGRRTARSHRTQEPLPFVHEPRVPHAAHLDDQHHRHPAVAPRRAADARTAEAGGIHPHFGARAHRHGRRPARPRQGRGRARHHLARNGSRWWTCSPRCAACSSPSSRALPSRWCSTNRKATSSCYTDDKKLSQILRNFISNALKFTPEGEVRVTAALLPGRSRGVRGHGHRHRNCGRTRCPICSRTSCSSTCVCRSACAARASDSRWHESSPSCSVAKCMPRASSAKDRASRWCCPMNLAAAQGAQVIA